MRKKYLSQLSTCHGENAQETRRGRKLSQLIKVTNEKFRATSSSMSFISRQGSWLPLPLLMNTMIKVPVQREQAT